MMRVTMLLILLTAKCQDSHCGFNANPVTIDESLKEVIVDIHNAIRRNISNASNMKKMTWDEELAKSCQDMASFCRSASDLEAPYHGRPGSLGENMIWDPENEFLMDDVVERGVQVWYAEKIQCEMSQTFSNRDLCSMYKQLVRADNDRIGCSAVTCPLPDPPNGAPEGLMFCCVYGPVKVTNESLYEDPKNIFIPGKSCSKCGENYGCENNLCVSCDESPSACPTSDPVTASPQQMTRVPVSSTTSGSLSLTTNTVAIIHSSIFVGFVLKFLCSQ